MADTTNTQDRPVVTRAAAKAAGAPRFFTGRPCKRGHVSERHTHNGVCVDCKRVWAAADYAAHPERQRIASAKWYLRNRERLIAKDAAYTRANRHIRRAAQAARHAADPSKLTAKNAIRRARKQQAGGTHTAADIQALLKRQRGKCAHPWCATSLAGGYHEDHRTPFALGGSNDRRNIQLLCPPCNLSKGRKHPIDHAQRHGLLL